MNMKRNYVKESEDLAGHKYAYAFDDVLRGYMMQTFRPWLPRGRALELGCYRGEFTALLAEHYADLTVIEAAANLIEQASARVGKTVKFIHSTFEEAKLADTYDAIFLVHTLEHLDDRIGVLKRINGWLAGGGKLFVAVPNANAASRRIAVKMGLIPHPAAVTETEFRHGHRITYTFESLEAEMSQSGLKIERKGGVFFKPFANFQFDKLMESGVVGREYLDGCYRLGFDYPDLCASIYLVCGKGGTS